MAKKGDISITTIIVAAIALIVLVVLIAIFTGRLSMFSTQYDKTTTNTQGQVCATGGGRCIKSDQFCPGNTPIAPIGGWIDCASGEKCCR